MRWTETRSHEMTQRIFVLSHHLIESFLYIWFPLRMAHKMLSLICLFAWGVGGSNILCTDIIDGILDKARLWVSLLCLPLLVRFQNNESNRQMPHFHVTHILPSFPLRVFFSIFECKLKKCVSAIVIEWKNSCLDMMWYGSGGGGGAQYDSAHDGNTAAIAGWCDMWCGEVDSYANARSSQRCGGFRVPWKREA